MHAAAPRSFQDPARPSPAARCLRPGCAAAAPAFLEDLGDGRLGGLLVGSGGGIIVAGAFDGLRDSVDGTLDGTCGPQGSKCHDWFSVNGTAGVTFSFNGGALPTAFGLVWSEGAGTATFTAFDGAGVELGTISRLGVGDGSFSGTTAEDRFFGVTYEGGIGSIKIANNGGGIEVDHVQYGAMAPVPEPPAWAMLAAGGLLAAARLRRRPAR